MIEYKIDTINLKKIDNTKKQITLSFDHSDQGTFYIFGNDKTLVTFTTSGKVYIAGAYDFDRIGLDLQK